MQRIFECIMKYRTSRVCTLKCVLPVDLVIVGPMDFGQKQKPNAQTCPTTLQFSGLGVSVKFDSSLLSFGLIRDLSEWEELLSTTVIEHCMASEISFCCRLGRVS